MGVPIIRTIVYWGLYLGYLNFGKLPYISTLNCRKNNSNRYVIVIVRRVVRLQTVRMVLILRG